MPSMPPSPCPPRSPWSSPPAPDSAAGGFYLLHRQSDGFETMLDAREKAPGAASRDMYLDKAGNPIARRFDRRAPGGGDSRRARRVRISGAPLRQAAAEGEPAAGDSPGARRLSAVSRACRARSATSASCLLRSPDAAKVFLTADGDVPELGALIKQPELADTLEAIAAARRQGIL